MTASRGKPVYDSQWAPCVVATVHPSAVLRTTDDASRRREYAAIVKDLRVVAAQIAHPLP